jgi:hypothetical protein
VQSTFNNKRINIIFIRVFILIFIKSHKNNERASKRLGINQDLSKELVKFGLEEVKK